MYAGPLIDFTPTGLVFEKIRKNTINQSNLPRHVEQSVGDRKRFELEILLWGKINKIY